MRSFKDSTGAVWDLDLTIGTAKRLSSRLAADNINLLDARGMMDRLGDIFFAIDCVAVLLEESLRERGITPSEFGSRLRGGSAFEAQRALIEEYIDFFPDPTIAAALRETMERSIETSKKAQVLVRRSLEKILAQQAAAVEEAAKSIGD